MKITLHFGAHRTASTTLQRVLGGSGTALKAQGIAYWGPKRTRSGLFEGVLSAPETEMPWVKRRPLRAAGRIALALEQAALHGARQVLVSEENMLGSMRKSLAQGVLYPDAEAKMARLAEAFGGQVDQIGVAIRSYDHYWASVLANQMTRGGPLPEPDFIDTLVSQTRRWRHLLGAFARHFPKAKIRVWSHEAMAARPDEILAHLLDCDPRRLQGVRDWHNTGPSAGSLRAVMREMAAPSAMIDRAIDETANRFMPFLPNQRAKLRGDYLSDLAWLRDVAGAQFDYIDDLGHNAWTGRHEGLSDDQGPQEQGRGEAGFARMA
ncbi:MAG: hypothetical protein AAFN09_06370 [Pseudomonadota bacterium]